MKTVKVSIIDENTLSLLEDANKGDIISLKDLHERDIDKSNISDVVKARIQADVEAELKKLKAQMIEEKEKDLKVVALQKEKELKEKNVNTPIAQVEENTNNQAEENTHTGETLEEETEEYSIKEEQEENNNEIKESSDEAKIENEDDTNINKENEAEDSHENAENHLENSDVKDIQDSTTSEQTVDNTNEIIENIENPEIKQEFKEIKEKMQQLNDNPQVVTDDFNEMYAKLFGRLPIQDNEEKIEKKEEKDIDILKDNVSVFEGIEEYQKPAYKFIGIVFKTYIIIEIGQEMYILDQHAAHERIMYEKVKENYYSESSKDSQMLLLPDVITLTHKEMDIAKENMEMFRKAGFTLEEFGENTIKLTGVPTVCIDLDTKELFLETLDEINTVARTAKQEKEEKFIATVACKAAVKANMALDQKEVESLMDKLLSLPNPFTCPHGRPTAIKMTKYDIERKFARK